MLLQINGTDYTKNIIAGTYEVNEQDVELDSWRDGNGKQHKNVVKKTMGKMSMWFRNKADYWKFQSDLTKARNSQSSAYSLKVARNNISTELSSEFYVECLPSRGRNVANQDEYRDFEFTIEER